MAVLQAVFCAACLPSTGTWDSGTKDAGKIIEGTASVGKGGGKGSVRRKGGRATTSSGGGGDGDRIWGNKIMVCQFLLSWNA